MVQQRARFGGGALLKKGSFILMFGLSNQIGMVYIWYGSKYHRNIR